MNRLFSLAFAIVLLVSGISFSSASGAGNGATSNAQMALAAAFSDAEVRDKNTENLRFAFTARVETGTEDNPLIEYVFDPLKPEAEQYDFIHPSVEENAKARKKILKQQQKTREKRRKSGEAIMPDRDLLANVSRKPQTDDVLRFLRETPTGYVFALNLGSFKVDFGNGGEDSNKTGKNKDKKDNNNFAKYLSGEIAVGKDNNQFRWMRIFSTKPFKPVAVAKIKKFEIYMTLAPVWPGGPLVKVRQEFTVSGKAMFRKFEQHSVIESFAFDKR